MIRAVGCRRLKFNNLAKTIIIVDRSLFSQRGLLSVVVMLVVVVVVVFMLLPCDKTRVPPRATILLVFA